MDFFLFNLTLHAAGKAGWNLTLKHYIAHHKILETLRVKWVFLSCNFYLISPSENRTHNRLQLDALLMH